MIYTFLKDEAELSRFVDPCLPDTTEDECFVLFLSVRRKYLSDEEKELYQFGPSEVFRREIVASKDDVVKKVKELGVDSEVYLDRNGQVIPEHAFSVYFTPNPRSHRKAALAMVHGLVDKIHTNQPILLDSLTKTELHKAFSRKIYMDFDVDPKESDDLEKILIQMNKCLGQSRYFTVSTNTGAHVLLETAGIDPEKQSTFYREIEEISETMAGEIEIRNDAMLPLPGCAHGGAVPRLL